MAFVLGRGRAVVVVPGHGRQSSQCQTAVEVSTPSHVSCGSRQFAGIGGSCAPLGQLRGTWTSGCGFVVGTVVGVVGGAVSGSVLGTVAGTVSGSVGSDARVVGVVDPLAG